MRVLKIQFIFNFMEAIMKHLSVMLVMLLLFFVMLNGQVYQQVGNAGGINWQDQIIRASGIGAPNPAHPLAAQRAGALRAAKSDAVRNILEVVKGMAITSETTVENAMVSSDVIKTRVEGIVKNFRQVGEPRYMSDGSVEVDIEVPLSGVLMDALLPVHPGMPMAPGQGYPLGPPAGFQPMNQIFTGLIVDARGVGLRPAMAPKIIDEMGNEVYGTGFVSRDYAVQIGVVGYEKDINRAQQNERVTDNPLVVKGVKVSGSNKTDVVISNNDAQHVLNAGKNLNFMDQCKVIIILD
jgi:hypothetical protein